MQTSRLGDSSMSGLISKRFNIKNYINIFNILKWFTIGGAALCPLPKSPETSPEVHSF